MTILNVVLTTTFNAIQIWMNVVVHNTTTVNLKKHDNEIERTNFDGIIHGYIEFQVNIDECDRDTTEYVS